MQPDKSPPTTGSPLTDDEPYTIVDLFDDLVRDELFGTRPSAGRVDEVICRFLEELRDPTEEVMEALYKHARYLSQRLTSSSPDTFSKDELLSQLDPEDW